MSRFEKRVTDEQIAAARAKIAAGATLRAAAAEIPCAASTLSYRINRAKQAEAAAVETNAELSSQAPSVVPADMLEVAVEPIGPLEVLREALQATKADGQPDWATRISAARTLGTLRPQELEPKPGKTRVHPEIVVFDLPPGSNPVTHRAIEGDPGDKPDGAAGSATPEPETPSGRPQPLNPIVFCFAPSNDPGGRELIGTWTAPVAVRDPHGVTALTFTTTDKQSVADQWRAELAAGRLPQTEDSS